MATQPRNETIHAADRGPITERGGGLYDLTSPITRLAIAWSEGDHEAGEILFRNVLRFLRPAAGRFALMCKDQSTTDVLNAAYVHLTKLGPRQFSDRLRFVRTYIKAMDFWFKEYRRRWLAQKRSAPETSDFDGVASASSDGLVHLLLDIERIREDLLGRKLISELEADLFYRSRVLGVSHVDLAEIYGMDRRDVGDAVRFASAMFAKELAHYRQDSDADA